MRLSKPAKESSSVWKLRRTSAARRKSSKKTCVTSCTTKKVSFKQWRANKQRWIKRIANAESSKKPKNSK